MSRHERFAFLSLFAGTLRKLLLLAGLCAVVPVVALAQAGAGPLPPQPGATTQPPPQARISVQVRLVSEPAVVRDSKGNMVVTLAEKDFRIFDNGVEQRIDHFDLGGDPVSVVLLIETSSRVVPQLPVIQKAGIVFTQDVLGETGEAAVIAFNDEVTHGSGFSTDHDALEKGIANVPSGGAGAHLYDAMATAVNMLRDRPLDHRRVIIVLSEAVDRGSEAKFGEVLRDAELANVTIFSVGLSTTANELRTKPTGSDTPPSATPPGISGSAPTPGTPQTPMTDDARTGGLDLGALAVWTVTHAADTVRANALEVAATATGGEHVATFRDHTIEDALDRIGGDLHAQYTIAYHPTRVSDTGYHEIKVQVDRAGLKVQARPGYYLPPAS
jgi:VWFA-related protein